MYTRTHFNVLPKYSKCLTIAMMQWNGLICHYLNTSTVYIFIYIDVAVITHTHTHTSSRCNHMSLAFYMSVRWSKWASVCCWWYAFVLLSLYNRPEIAGIRNANGIVCVHYSDSFLVVNMRLVVSEFFFLSLVLFIHRWFVCCCFLSLCVCVCWFSIFFLYKT